MVGHEFRHAPQRAYIKELLDNGYIDRVRLCTMELFLDRYVTREPRPLTRMAYESEGGGALGALGSHYIDGLRHWFRATHVPYKGSGPAMLDLTAGRLQFMIDSGLMTYARAGKVRTSPAAKRRVSPSRGL